ncbi:MAG: hypothetical protein NBV55_01340 [Polynucleobacter sp.]|nr:hypothetical protein [Polynucleobacter sp.]
MTELRDLNAWLDANVVHYPEPKNITLSHFEIDWDELRGNFALTLDSKAIEPKIRFSLGSNGFMEFWAPIFQSPLGVPASYAMFEITEATNKAIKEALKEAFGHFRPLGLNKDLNKLITGYTPTLERLWADNPLEAIRERLNVKEFFIAVSVTA